MSSSEPDQHTLVHVSCDECHDVDTVTVLKHAKDTEQSEAVIDAHHILAEEHAENTGHSTEVGVSEDDPETVTSFAESLREELAGVEYAADGGAEVSRDDRPPGKEEMPDPVYELESVAHQVCWYWQKETMFPGENALDERDDRTVSVVVRDEDGEIIGESRLWEFAGTYALVRFQNGDVETLEKKEPVPDLPSWVEWVHADVPLDHHVVAVRCTECDQEYERYDGSMPGRAARTEPWGQIDHRPDCSHASDLDQKKWWGRQYAIKVRARPDPRVMALDCLWDELAELRTERGRMYAETAIKDRHVAIFNVLKDRMQTNYPGCSKCGGEIRRIDEWGLECSDCHETISDEVYQEWWDQHRRLWGLRGQGDRGWSPEEVDDGR